MTPDPYATTGGATSATATLLDPVPIPPSGGYIACVYNTELNFPTTFRVHGGEYAVGETVPLAPGRYTVSFSTGGGVPSPASLQRVVVTSGNVTVILVNFEGPAQVSRAKPARKPAVKKRATTPRGS